MATTLKAIKEKIKDNKTLSGDELGRLLIFDIINMYKNIGKDTPTLIQDNLIKTTIQTFNKKDIQDYNFYSSLYNSINENYTFINACFKEALYNASEIKLNLSSNLLTYKIFKQGVINTAEAQKLAKIKALMLGNPDNNTGSITIDYKIEKDKLINIKQSTIITNLEKLANNFQKIAEASTSLILYNAYLDCIATVYNLELKPAQANLQSIKNACDNIQELKAIFIDEIKENKTISSKEQEQAINTLNIKFSAIDPYAYKVEEENKLKFIELLKANGHNEKAIKLVSSVFYGIAFISGEPLKEV